jgi:hypothetical protein
MECCAFKRSHYLVHDLARLARYINSILFERLRHWGIQGADVGVAAEMVELVVQSCQWAMVARWRQIAENTEAIENPTISRHNVDGSRHHLQ